MSERSDVSAESFGVDQEGSTARTEAPRDATLAFAREVFAAIDAPLRRSGYLVALYGSVLLNGAGGDVDLLLVPWRRGAVSEDAIRIIVAHTGGVEVGKRYDGGMGTLATTIVTRGVILDVQVREAHRGVPTSVVLAVDPSWSTPKKTEALSASPQHETERTR